MLPYRRTGLLLFWLAVSAWLPALAWGQQETARVWRDNTGKFSVNAEFLGIKNGRVQLRRVDTGQLVAVPIIRLSDADRQFLIELRRSAQQPETVSPPPFQTIPRDPPPPAGTPGNPPPAQPQTTPPGQIVPDLPDESLSGPPTVVAPPGNLPPANVPPANVPPANVPPNDPSTAQIQMPPVEMAPAPEPPSETWSAEPTPDITPLAQQPPAQIPDSPSLQPGNWQPPELPNTPDDNPSRMPVEVAEQTDSPFQPPPPPPMTRTEPLEQVEPQGIAETNPMPETFAPRQPQAVTPELPAAEMFSRNEPELQRNLNNTTPAPMTVPENELRDSDAAATLQPPDLPDRSSAFATPVSPAESATGNLPAPLETTLSDVPPTQAPLADETVPSLLEVPPAMERADEIVENTPPVLMEPPDLPSTTIDPPANSDQPIVSPDDLADATATPESRPESSEPPGVEFSPPSFNPREPSSESDVAMQVPPLLEPSTAGPPVSVPPGMESENTIPEIAEFQPPDRPEVPLFRQRDRSEEMPTDDVADLAESPASFGTRQPSLKRSTPPPVSPRMVPAIAANALSVSAAVAGPEITEATDQQLLDQISLRSLVRWKGTAKLSALLEPEPPNFEVVINASGEGLESATHVGFIQFKSVRGVDGQICRPVMLPPRVPNVMTGWTKVVPNSGDQANDAFQQLLLPEITASVEFDRPGDLPTALTQVEGQLRVMLGTQSNVLTVSDVVNNLGRIDHELLRNKEADVFLRMPDPRTLIVESRGNVIEILDVVLVADDGEAVGESQSIGLRSAFYQFNFQSDITDPLDLQITVNDKGRELEIPFRFSDLQLPLEENRENTRLVPQIDR